MSLTKLFFICVCICCFNNAFAVNEVCPTPDEIRNHQYNYFVPLNIDNEEMASLSDIQKFKDHVTRFAVARWNLIYLESGHCFYEGTDPVVSKITFAQDAWRPVKEGKWVWKNPDNVAECYSDNVQDCMFIS